MLRRLPVLRTRELAALVVAWAGLRYAPPSWMLAEVVAALLNRCAVPSDRVHHTLPSMFLRYACQL